MGYIEAIAPANSLPQSHMRKLRTYIRLLSVSIVISTIANLSYLSAAAFGDDKQNDTQVSIENIKYPNGIPEHQRPTEQNTPYVPSSIEYQTDPSVTIGPSVIVGPNVYIKGEPLPNPLLKDVLPKDHPLLIHPEMQQ